MSCCRKGLLFSHKNYGCCCHGGIHKDPHDTGFDLESENEHGYGLLLYAAITLITLFGAIRIGMLILKR
ncbi:MAG: hypothetical protein FWG40_07510 [Peptococcaceae bacterium]|nr:hypothetical protein [Peptococcaceae bacterium]